jgi:cellulase
MYKTISSLSAIAALAATATAHGTVTGVTINGVFEQGFKLDYYYAMQNKGEIPEHAGWYAEDLDNGFVSPDAYATADIICHKAGSPKGSSDTMAKVTAGGVVEFNWSVWPESHMGPVITYVAPYTGDIEAVKKEELKWTKIDGAGYENGEWAAVKMIAQNNTWPVTVPETLAAGKYVFRHEIIALHGAGSENGAQNYPQCVVSLNQSSQHQTRRKS